MTDEQMRASIERWRISNYRYKIKTNDGNQEFHHIAFENYTNPLVTFQCLMASSGMLFFKKSMARSATLASYMPKDTATGSKQQYFPRTTVTGKATI